MNAGALSAYPYASARMPVLGTRGVVAASQPLAAQAGLEMIRRGGNAVDAALAAAVSLTVLEPTSNGIGGDAFALVWDGSRLHGLNGSGRAPLGLDAGLLERRGLDAVPALGWLPVTVPGVPAAWRDLHERFGRLDFAALFEPAVRYARDGYPVGPVLSRFWKAAVRRFAALEGGEFRPWLATFAPGGEGPSPGDVVRLPDHARTLRQIADSRAEAFYRGELARAIEDFAGTTGGVITAADLAAHDSSWVEPISTAYRGFEVHEMPPNGQGIAALGALNILEGFDLGRHARESAGAYHLQIEAMKLAFSDARAHVADPERAEVPTRGLLDKDYAAERRALIGDQALEPAPGRPPRGGTVYLCAADGDGMMVSYIQSNYAGFGSGVVVPGTGIALQNRGANFTLEAGHPNRLEPGKRPYHTIIPGFLTRAGEAVGPFGVMGGSMQPQGHVQVVVNTVDYGLNPQSALDAPRWQWLEGRRVSLEQRVPRSVAEGLRDRGHEASLELEGSSFGRGQIIWRIGEALVAGSEPRADGQAVAL